MSKKKFNRFAYKLRAGLASWIEPKNQRSFDKWEMSLREWLIYHQKEIHFDQVSWMGVKLQKNPFDTWIYHELLWTLKPDVLIEIGSFKGGSTLYFAHLMDIIGKGRVISVDISREHFEVSHNRISIVTGNSYSAETLTEVEALLQDEQVVMVLHDGNHEKEHVLKDLEAYEKFVTVGSYLIVEDGIVDIMGADFGWYEQGGPVAAVEAFLEKCQNFVIDEACERYLLTYNPKGYLKRIP